MTRLRTHNKRAKRVPYKVFARRRRQAWKMAQYAKMYGMGADKLRDMGRRIEGRYFPHQQEFIDKFFESNGGPIFGTATGRTVVRGPEEMHLYQLPRGLGMTRSIGPFVATNFAEQEARALAHHRASLEAARERGDEVIEHTYADATVIPKMGDDK